MEHYNHKKIEKKWQNKWEKQELYKTSDTKEGSENFYTLVEFPYPSGNLHVGHWYAFAVPDIFARFHRMQGRNVLYPIGFDAFGLPAENAAIKHNIDPKKWTYDNIDFMRKQLKTMGNSFDWSREIITADPEYYRWNQWLFLEFYKKGLVYKGERIVNWDPVDQTVLADEQVLPDGTAERSGAKVEKKELAQWMFKITDYAERLIEDLKGLDWPEEIKRAQENWIGKSEGAEIDFIIDDDKKLTVFTTRPDTLFGATYLVLAPEHKLLDELKNSIKNWKEVEKYILEAKEKSEIERTAEGKDLSANKTGKVGVKLENIKAVNPATKEKIPVFIADYVLVHYGTGAIMAVPAHDQRDWYFADKRDLKIVPVIFPKQGSIEKNSVTIPWAPDLVEKFVKNIKQTGAYTKEGILINSGKFDEMDSKDAMDKIVKFVNGRKTTTYKLRDWVISRQRYWGTPIPIVYDPDGEAHPIPEEHLPWILPTDVDYKPKGISPLGSSKEFAQRTEKIFGKGWKPETDTMDTFMDSSWYYLRYIDHRNNKEFSSIEKQKLWMPVNYYSGGAEHTTMHLLYSRFFYKALYDFKLVTEKEPYLKRMNRGLILDEQGKKMSKRWGNAIDPDEQVKYVGSDAVKTYLAFIGPYNKTGSYPWDSGGIVGIRRFFEKVWNIQNNLSDKENKKVKQLLHKTIKKVGEDIEAMKFNTAISQMMIFVNLVEKEKNISKETYEVFLKLLAPFAPHITEELWEKMGNKESIHKESWPKFDSKILKSDTMTITVQVNGKVRGQFDVPTEEKQKKIEEVAVGLDIVQRYIKDQKVKKIIYISGKLVSIVV